jgi:hypothetical protein
MKTYLFLSYIYYIWILQPVKLLQGWKSLVTGAQKGNLTESFFWPMEWRDRVIFQGHCQLNILQVCEYFHILWYFVCLRSLQNRLLSFKSLAWVKSQSWITLNVISYLAFGCYLTRLLSKWHVIVTKAIREIDLACMTSFSASYSVRWRSPLGPRITKFDFAQIKTLIFQIILVL